MDALLQDWREDGLPLKVLFLDASDQVLIKRYKETRRSHPLGRQGPDRRRHRQRAGKTGISQKEGRCDH